MAKNIHCVTARESAGYDKLIELNNGDEAVARRIWEDNNFKVPAEAMAMVGEDIVDNKFIIEDVIETDSIIISKQKAVRKAKALMIAKLKKLERLQNIDAGLQKGKEELESILDKIDEVTAEETLIDFISAADRMTTSAENWLQKFKTGDKIATFDNLKKLEEYVASFSLLQELNEDMFENDQHKDIFKTVEKIIGRHTKIRNSYISESRKLISQKLQGNFHKITRLYEKKAEQYFNKYKKPHIEKSEVAQAKADFVAKYMTAHATEIDLRTSQYIENMLLQTVDIPILNAWVVNPKDMNNDIISIALESIDSADMQIWNTMETVVDDTEELNEAFINFIGKQSDQKQQYEIFFLKDKDGNILPEVINTNNIEFKEFRAKYENVPAVWNLYTHIKKLVTEKDRMVYNGAKLGYKLPMLEQSNIERLYSRGVISFIKEGTMDNFKLRGKDVELGLIADSELENQKLNKASDIEEVYVAESGEERATVPLYYRNSKIDPKDQSFDLMKSLVLDYHNSLKFKIKTETAVFLDVLKDVMHEADIIKTTSFVEKLKKNKESNELHTVKGESEISKVLEALIRHRIYGIHTEGDAHTAKILQSIGKYTSFLTMSANALSGAANILQGTTLSWIEAVGGNTGYFTPKDRAKAVAQYNSNLGGLMSDIGERRPKNKINLLVRHFNALSESNLLNGKSYAQNNKIKRIADTSALMSANGLGEHAMQTITMLATLNNNKVKDVNGNYLDKDFNITTDRNEAIGVADGMIVNDGKLEFHPSVDSTERTNGVKLEDITKISLMVRRISRDLFGNYDSENKAMYQRTGAGALVSQMRGWLVPGFQKRWRGIGTSGAFSKDNFVPIGEEYTFERAHKLSYNTDINEFEEGQYITAIRWLRTATKEMKALGVIAGTKDAWNTMDDQQKANVRKTLIEAALIAGFLILSKIFDDDKDDPNDIENVYAAYIARRMYSELFTFANPNETMRTFRSPAIAISSVENAIKVAEQLFSGPLDVYEGGRHTGDYKLWRNIKKMIPIYKQYDRNIEDSYAFLKNN
jgi:hypothetical protein